MSNQLKKNYYNHYSISRHTKDKCWELHPKLQVKRKKSKDDNFQKKGVVLVLNVTKIVELPKLKKVDSKQSLMVRNPKKKMRTKSTKGALLLKDLGEVEHHYGYFRSQNLEEPHLLKFHSKARIINQDSSTSLSSWLDLVGFRVETLPAMYLQICNY